MARSRTVDLGRERTSTRPTQPRATNALGRPATPRLPAPQRPADSVAVDPSIARLTAQAKALLSQWHGGDARTRVALGSVLQQVRHKLEHGQWLGWLEKTVPFKPRAAQNYIELAGWAQSSPELFEQVAPLGASKAYLLSRLSAAQLHQLLAKPEHLVPGTKRMTTLLLMTYSEFVKTILHATRPMPPPTDPMVALIADARSSANKTIKLMKLLIANKQALDQDAVEDLHDDLMVALQKLSQAFKLD